MKKIILKSNALLIALAIMFQLIGMPMIANAGWHSSYTQEEKSNTGTILIGVSIAISITVIIIVLSKKKRRKHAMLFQELPSNYTLAQKFIPNEAIKEMQTLKQEAIVSIGSSPFCQPSLFMKYGIQMNEKEAAINRFDFLQPSYDRKIGIGSQGAVCSLDF
jgi:hypothetical protein